MSKQVESGRVEATTRRALSATQRDHLAQMIAVMNVAQGRLEGAQRVAQAQVDAAQKEFDQARDQAQAFLNYCATELGVSYSSGEWDFHQGLMEFVLRPDAAQPMPPPSDFPSLPADEALVNPPAIHVNGSAP